MTSASHASQAMESSQCSGIYFIGARIIHHYSSYLKLDNGVFRMQEPMLRTYCTINNSNNIYIAPTYSKDLHIVEVKTKITYIEITNIY